MLGWRKRWACALASPQVWGANSKNAASSGKITLQRGPERRLGGSAKKQGRRSGPTATPSKPLGPGSRRNGWWSRRRLVVVDSLHLERPVVGRAGMRTQPSDEIARDLQIETPMGCVSWSALSTDCVASSSRFAQGQGIAQFQSTSGTCAQHSVPAGYSQRSMTRQIRAICWQQQTLVFPDCASVALRGRWLQVLRTPYTIALPSSAPVLDAHEQLWFNGSSSGPLV